MKSKHLGKACRQLAGWGRWRQQQCCSAQAQYPAALTQSCCGRNLRICSVRGDRRTCARMASLGFLPGQEIELICKPGADQCMVKINGSTISLDAESAAAIDVTPVQDL